MTASAPVARSTTVATPTTLPPISRTASTAVDGEAPVVLRSQSGGATESYVDWADVTGSTTRMGLKEVNWLTGTGSLGGTATTGWNRTAYALSDSGASAGVVLLTNGWAGLTGDVPSVWLPTVNRITAGVWQSASLPTTHIRGIPRLRLSVKPGNANGTVVAYLYDVDAFGTGDLVAHTVTTWLGAATGSTMSNPSGISWRAIISVISPFRRPNGIHPSASVTARRSERPVRPPTQIGTRGWTAHGSTSTESHR